MFVKFEMDIRCAGIQSVGQGFLDKPRNRPVFRFLIIDEQSLRRGGIQLFLRHFAQNSGGTLRQPFGQRQQLVVAHDNQVSGIAGDQFLEFLNPCRIGHGQIEFPAPLEDRDAVVFLHLLFGQDVLHNVAARVIRQIQNRIVEDSGQQFGQGLRVGNAVVEEHGDDVFSRPQCLLIPFDLVGGQYAVLH